MEHKKTKTCTLMNKDAGSLGELEMYTYKRYAPSSHQLDERIAKPRLTGT